MPCSERLGCVHPAAESWGDRRAQSALGVWGDQPWSRRKLDNWVEVRGPQENLTWRTHKQARGP